MLLPAATGGHLPATAIAEAAVVQGSVVTSIAEALGVEAARSVLVDERVGALGLVVSHLLAVGALDAGDWNAVSDLATCYPPWFTHCHEAWGTPC